MGHQDQAGSGRLLGADFVRLGGTNAANCQKCPFSALSMPKASTIAARTQAALPKDHMLQAEPRRYPGRLADGSGKGHNRARALEWSTTCAC